MKYLLVILLLCCFGICFAELEGTLLPNDNLSNMVYCPSDGKWYDCSKGPVTCPPVTVAIPPTGPSVEAEYDKITKTISIALPNNQTFKIDLTKVPGVELAGEGVSFKCEPEMTNINCEPMYDLTNGNKISGSSCELKATGNYICKEEAKLVREKTEYRDYFSGCMSVKPGNQTLDDWAEQMRDCKQRAKKYADTEEVLR